MKKKFLRLLKIVYYERKGKKKFRRKRRERRFRRRFFRSIFSLKATAVPNFRAVTLLWAEIMRVLLLVSKVAHSPPPFSPNNFKNILLESKNIFLAYPSILPRLIPHLDP